MIFTPAAQQEVQKPIPACPACGKSGKRVEAQTVNAQLKKEFKESLSHEADQFCFCTTPECDTVYYSLDGEESFPQAAIKSKVTIKNDDPSTPLCYCHKYTKQDALDDMKTMESHRLVRKIKEMIAGNKVCKKANPKGSCCTMDIRLFLAEHNIVWDEKRVSLSPRF